jgi:hypothetical protein
VFGIPFGFMAAIVVGDVAATWPTWAKCVLEDAATTAGPGGFSGGAEAVFSASFEFAAG